MPASTNGGVDDDVNGNGRKDFADVVLFFNLMSRIRGERTPEAFDRNGNGRIDRRRRLALQPPLTAFSGLNGNADDTGEIVSVIVPYRIG